MKFPRTLLIIVILFGAHHALAASEYRVPENPEVVQLLTATQTPEAEFNAASGRIALSTARRWCRWRASPGPISGWRASIDPDIRTSGYDSRVKRVEVLDARSGVTVSSWLPEGEPALDWIDISPTAAT